MAAALGRLEAKHLAVVDPNHVFGLKVRVRDAEAVQVAEGRGELRQGQDHLEDTKHTHKTPRSPKK
jgi:hypothetical protein